MSRRHSTTVFLGFPVAILLAWAFDLTPGGVERTPLLRDDGTPVGPAAASGDTSSRTRLRTARWRFSLSPT